MNNNICNFVPFHKDYHSIHTINFVYETSKSVFNESRTEFVFKMYYVNNGTGMLRIQDSIKELKKGDVFFTFPDIPFSIESSEDFKVTYISFLGTRGIIIEDMLGISYKNCVFHDCDDVGFVWEKGIETDESLSGLVSESVLLYTFSFIGNRIAKNDKTGIKQNDTISIIKKYIDDNLSDPSLSLEKISKELNYNKKYISTVFKKNINVGFSEYLNTIRIQYACTMMQEGYTCINDISHKCGYSDSHYFSNVFKKKMGISPKGYINKM